MSFLKLHILTYYSRIFGTILGNFLKPMGNSIIDFSPHLVESTIEVYNTIATELLPTPSKSHYTFNLRDLSKVFQGILQVKKVDDLPSLLKLWWHECMRVFHDRLVDDTDRSWFHDILENKMQKWMNLELDDITANTNNIIYGDFVNPAANPRIYEEIDDMSKLIKAMTDYLDYYNGTAEKPMHLVLFLDAIEHVARISRIIRQPRGHALLLGMGGSGKQSLTRMAAAMADYELFQIEISSSYGVNEWRDDLRKVLLDTGLEEKKIVFLFSDTQIVQESFLEDLNNMLNTGDIPTIFGNEEMETIANTIGPVVQSMGLQVNKEIIYSHFLKRVQQNLHVVICMSPIGDSFRNRLRMFPSLVNCCTIDWFKPWPKEALNSVATKFLQDMIVPNESRTNLVTMCMEMHLLVENSSKNYKEELNRHNYVTPASYLQLLAVFKDINETKKAELGTLRKRLQIGLDKLLDTTHEVAILQEELKASRPLLEQANRETEETMQQIVTDKASADETRKVVVREEAEANKKAEETQSIADDARRDLDEALPALESAESALRTLNKKDISEVKTLVRPPLGVKMVMETICIILGVKPKKVDGPKLGEKVKNFLGNFSDFSVIGG